jgi:hypothetical protein
LFESSHGSGVWSLRAFASPSHDEAPTSSGHFSEEPEIYEAKEGNQVLRAHMDRERSSPLISKFKASLADPRCEACTVQLSEIYGDLAKDYIEAHHRIPISKDSERLTRFEDLAALCPNCHRIIHKNYPMSVEELGDILAQSDSFSQHLIAVRSSRTTWQTAVRNAIERLVENTSNRRFSRQSLIEWELDKIVEEVNSAGITPSQTLSRVLQELRDNNEIVFLDEERGEYLAKLLF